MINKIVENSFRDGKICSAICGWINYENENTFEAEMKIIKSSEL